MSKDGPALAIHVLNLARDQGRRERMSRLLGDMGLAFGFVDAVLGSALSDDDVRAFEHHATMLLSRAEIGCLLSHAKAWKAIAQGKEDAGLILEDDLHFAPRFPELIRTVAIDPDQLCIHRLETFFATVTASRRAEQRLGAYGFYELFTNHGGGGAYILNRKTASRLSDLAYSMQRAVDTELFDPSRRTIPPLTIYQCIPAPCVQDHLLGDGPSAEFLESRIGKDREDLKLEIAKPQAPLPARLKDWLRPAYRAAYSALLAPQGRRRVKIPYG